MRKSLPNCSNWVPDFAHPIGGTSTISTVFQMDYSQVTQANNCEVQAAIKSTEDLKKQEGGAIIILEEVPDQERFRCPTSQN